MASAQGKFRDATGQFFRSRRKALEVLRTLALVIPLTCLIWIYAERKQLYQADAQIILDVATREPNLYAEIVNPTTILVHLSGPRARVDALKSTLESTTVDHRYKVTLPETYRNAGEPSVPVAMLLNQDKQIDQSGVTVTSAAPATITVRIEKIVSRELPLQMPDVGTKLQNIVFDPPTVRIRGPQSIIERDFAGADAAVFAKFPENPPADALAPGPHSVRLLIDLGNDKVTADQKDVNVRYDVVSREAEYTISSLPITVQLLLPMLQQNIHVTVTPQVVTNIKVRGPADAIDKLRLGPQGQPPKQQVVAVLRISSEDIGKPELRLPVQITDLPSGVTVVGTPPQLDVSIRENDGAGG